VVAGAVALQAGPVLLTETASGCSIDHVADIEFLATTAE